MASVLVSTAAGSAQLMNLVKRQDATQCSTVTVTVTVQAQPTPAVNHSYVGGNNAETVKGGDNVGDRLQCVAVVARSKESQSSCNPATNRQSTPLKSGDKSQNLNTFCYSNGKSAAALFTCDKTDTSVGAVDRARRFAVPGDSDFNGEGAGCEHSCQAVALQLCNGDNDCANLINKESQQCQTFCKASVADARSQGIVKAAQ